MPLLLSDELRLAYALLLQAAALAGAWRFVARRVATDWADRATDALLLALLVQYAAVTLPGLCGVLSPLTIALTTIALSVVLYFAPTRTPVAPIPVELPPADRSLVLACALFLLGYVTTLVFAQPLLPVMSSDALTYHFPAAVRWLQTGRLVLFETWFFNPANTYSPLAGSAFVAWWIAPVGNDVLARNVQVPPLVLIFLAGLRPMRGLGARPALAAVLALALALSRPFLRQSIIEKDDLYLAAFFACFVAGCSKDRLTDRLGALRLGVSLGLLLATKYTALLALPILLLLVDAPLRARWPLRRYATGATLALLIAGPWYLRNWILTGNPLYPLDVTIFGATIFRGMFASAPSEQLRAFRSIAAVLTTRDQSLPVWPTIPLLIALVAAWAARAREVISHPLLRAVLLGPIVALAVFVAAAPYAEVRFLFPAFVLLFAAAAVAIDRWIPPLALQLAAAAFILVAACATTFNWVGDRAQVLLEAVVIASVVAGVGLVFAWLLRRFSERRPALLGFGGGAALLALAAAVYVEWPGYMKNRRDAAGVLYRAQYGSIADAWNFVREQVPPAEAVAYANTFLVYPMSGPDNARQLLYVPTRRGVRHLHDLPHLPGRHSGETLVPAVAAATTADTDAAAWLNNLFASPATHLVVFHNAVGANPPELAIARAHPAKFHPVFTSGDATVYRLRRD